MIGHAELLSDLRQAYPEMVPESADGSLVIRNWVTPDVTTRALGYLDGNFFPTVVQRVSGGIGTYDQQPASTGSREVLKATLGAGLWRIRVQYHQVVATGDSTKTCFVLLRPVASPLRYGGGLLTALCTANAPFSTIVERKVLSREDFQVILSFPATVAAQIIDVGMATTWELLL